MRLIQSQASVEAVSESLLGTLYMRTDRADDDFIQDMMEAIQDFRKVRGLKPMPRADAYSGAYFILKRLKMRGWQFSPPLMPMVGGVLQGSRRKD